MNPATSVDEMARRLGRLSADQVMVTSPETMPAGASVADVRTALADEHVHMVLLTDGDVLRGTIVRADLTPGRSPTDSALELSTLLVGRSCRRCPRRRFSPPNHAPAKARSRSSRPEIAGSHLSEAPAQRLL